MTPENYELRSIIESKIKMMYGITEWTPELNNEFNKLRMHLELVGCDHTFPWGLTSIEGLNFCTICRRYLP